MTYLIVNNLGYSVPTCPVVDIVDYDFDFEFLEVGQVLKTVIVKF